MGRGGGGGSSGGGSGHFSGGGRSSGHFSSGASRGGRGGGIPSFGAIGKYGTAGTLHNVDISPELTPFFIGMDENGDGEVTLDEALTHISEHEYNLGDHIFLYAAGFLIFSIILPLILSFLNLFPSDVTKSTIAREPLPVSYTETTPFYVDEIGWINSETELTDGMQTFYEKTGVYPLLYITDNVNGCSDWGYITDHINEFAIQVYQSYIADEGHIVVVFCEYKSSQWLTAYAVGNDAASVMDGEAISILSDFIKRYYPSNLSDEEMFSVAFRRAGHRIMHKPMHPLLTAAIVAAGGTVVIFVMYRRMNHPRSAAQRNRPKPQRKPQ